MVIHYKKDEHKAACGIFYGKSFWVPRATRDPEEVTCDNCKRTNYWRDERFNYKYRKVRGR